MRIVVTLVLALLCLPWTADGGEAKALYPKEKRVTYRDASGRTRVYLVQEPEPLKPGAKVLIYMHGAGGKEEQGMDVRYACRTFGRLRPLMNEMGWIYACPRDSEYKGLLEHLKKTYNPGQIVLAGASAGGASVVWEVGRNPAPYAGLILMCPAMRSWKGIERFKAPIYVVGGEYDTMIRLRTLSFLRLLKKRGMKHTYIEIPKGDHGAPVEQIDWKVALTFVLSGNGGE
ncbi:MAG: hypothetical protein ACYTGH_07840 [Planctomycetota bacterium]|jgi:acetyl esterase/lipase